MKVLGLDMGFSSLGYAVVALDPDRDRLLDLGVVRTEKSEKKANVNQSDDNLRRAKELARELSAIIERHGPWVVALERQSWPRNASAAVKVAQAWGVVATLIERFKLSDISASPQEVKKAVCGVKTASKEEVQSSVELYFDHDGWEWPKQRTLWEHCGDAAAVVMALRQSPLILWMLQMRGRS